MRIGRPDHAFDVGWKRLQLWNYRWWQGNCVWFQVSIGQQSGRATEAGYGPDPICDASTRLRAWSSAAPVRLRTAIVARLSPFLRRPFESRGVAAS